MTTNQEKDELRNLVYVYENEVQTPADGIVFFGEGYADYNRITLDSEFDKTKKECGNCLVYDCGEHALYRHAVYCCEFESPWFPFEKLLALGKHSIIVVFSKGLSQEHVSRILGKLSEHGYALYRRQELDERVHPLLWIKAAQMKLYKAREQHFDAFRRWLREQPQLSPRAKGDADSRARRVERDLFGGINLDTEYAQDRLARVLQALEYTAEDVHNHREPPEGIIFRFNPDEPRYYERVKAVLHDLHNAVKRYRDFCDDGNPQ